MQPDAPVPRQPSWPVSGVDAIPQRRPPVPRPTCHKKQDHHVTTAATATALQDTIIKDSKKQDPTINAEWTEDTFEAVDWQANGSSFKALAPGRQLQISKYAHEWTPTMHY
jgi:uridine kinase